MVEAHTVCRECGAKLPDGKTCQDLCHELTFYTLAHGQKEFIHQHVVDAYAAQHVREDTKPIGVAAPLVGLYLFAERRYTGRQVQQAHMALGNKMKEWPRFAAPKQRSTLTVVDVLAAPAGSGRDEMIRKWARLVWEMWEETHSEIERLVRSSYEVAFRPRRG